MKMRLFFSVILVLQATACSLTFDVGLEPLPTSENLLPTATVVVLPTSTPTLPPTEVPTSTPVPTLTPLPGNVVIPVTSLGTDIPWLPLDRSRYPTVFIITINNQMPPFDNPLVRRAFAASIDRDVIVGMAKKWYAVDPSPATTFIPPETLGRDLYGEMGINYDPARARDLLAQAGYTDTSAFPKVLFLVNSYGDTAPGARFNMANAIAEMWKNNLGITVEVQALSRLAFGDRVRSDPPALFWNGWLPDPGNDPDFIRQVFSTDAEYNYGHFSNPDFDSLVERAERSHDPAARQVLYIEAERLLCEMEAGIIPLYHTFSNIP